MGILLRYDKTLIIESYATLRTETAKRFGDSRPIPVAAVEDEVRLHREGGLVDAETHFLLDGVALPVR